jgi:diguanylate cyclase (GGDEF)-like protein
MEMTTIEAYGTDAAGSDFRHALRWFDDSAACLALLVGAGYECVYANPACLRLAGLRPLVGRAFFEALPELEEQGVRLLFDRLAPGRRPYAARRRRIGLRGSGGALQWQLLDVILQPVFDLAGNRLGLLLQCCETGYADTRGASAAAQGQGQGHDRLTGLADAATFQRALDKALSGAPDAPGGTIVALDVHCFHRVNACVGRDGGDRILRDLAGRLAQATPPGTLAARDGANRFLFLLAADDAQAAAAPAGLLAALDAPFHDEGLPLYLGASVGVARFPEHGASAGQVMASLDCALAEARRTGPGAIRGGVHAGARAREQARMTAALRDAIDGHAIEVHYQPQADLASGRICGVEALVRWNSPEFGAVPADTIVHLAEESGLIERLGDRVLRIACAQGQAWRALGFRALRVAVNLSARQVRMQNLERMVLNALVKSGLPPACLDLELTETLVMEDIPQAVSCLQALKRCGIRLSLDDFGTGYSSLAYLRHLPVDALKIDRSFLDAVPGSARAAGLVGTIIASAHALGMRVVAEGVEREAQLRFLARHHCDEIQGYYFSKPVPAAQLTAMLLGGHVLKLTTPCRNPSDFAG